MARALRVLPGAAAGPDWITGVRRELAQDECHRSLTKNGHSFTAPNREHNPSARWSSERVR